MNTALPKPSVFVTPHKIIAGAGCFAQLGEETIQLGMKALLVCGQTALRASGKLDEAVASIQDAGAQVEVLDRVEPEPSLDTVEAGRRACQELDVNVVVGIGGGSALDVAKAIAALANSPLSVKEHFDGTETPDLGIPIVAVPTTAGTGTEVTVNSVLSEHGTQTKKSIRGRSLLPKVAIVDPELLLSLPRDLTANAGFDALTQAIEAYTSRNATPITDALAFDAFRSLAAGLPQALDDGSDIGARSQTAFGSLMAGMALANARLGVVHGLAHPLGIHYHIPHGLVCGALLPYAIRLNQEVAREKHERLSYVLGRPLLEFVDELLEQAGLAGALTDFGIKPDDFDMLAEKSLPSGSLKANPKEVTKEDLIGMLEEATQ